MSQGVLLDRPDDLPAWFEPLLARVSTCRTEDFTSLRRPAGGPGRSSAVLVLLGESPPAADTPGGPDLLILQRAATMRNHAGQPAFPGGATDPDDADAVATAVREAQEEVGLDVSSAHPLALLPELWIPVSRFSVTPVLAWWRKPHPVHPLQPAEVAHVARLPISELADPQNRIQVRHPSGWVAPAFQVRGLLVWGFTAGVISVLLDMAGWARPWDQGRVVELPDAEAPVPAARGGAPDEVVP
ncbi:NUDIX hydrolase [Actinoplanes teichomyceticus]|uniref:NUDIX domain-containing protein n=1 Tax=Actinoplanes teichomyceticus TaxID=1867 RepID=A0A561WQL4_ACTTI|nr:CoA pyrophosphatase [Actinoplanes teichomyceticus]TWG26159.1 NUDIX domain-containing protein [Actinoplanes teichomyceticus]GIF11238.1 coenzyme A pyrophosphatase [Actinoplanes teichomyceticus]